MPVCCCFRFARDRGLAWPRSFLLFAVRSKPIVALQCAPASCGPRPIDPRCRSTNLVLVRTACRVAVKIAAILAMCHRVGVIEPPDPPPQKCTELDGIDVLAGESRISSRIPILNGTRGVQKTAGQRCRKLPQPAAAPRGARHAAARDRSRSPTPAQDRRPASERPPASAARAVAQAVYREPARE